MKVESFLLQAHHNFLSCIYEYSYYLVAAGRNLDISVL
jgi:hypothetical protein